MKKNNKHIKGSIIATSLATIGFVSYKVLKKKYPNKFENINNYIKENINNIKSVVKKDEEKISDQIENDNFKNNNIPYNHNNKTSGIYQTNIINDNKDNINSSLNNENNIDITFSNFNEKIKEELQEHFDNNMCEDDKSVIMPDDYIEDEIRYQLCLSNKEVITRSVLKKLERIDFFEIDDNDLDLYCHFLNEYTNIKSIVIDALNPLKYDNNIQNSDYNHCLKNISPINNLEYLEELSFNWGIENIDFSSLTNLKKLKKLEIKFGMLNDISFISNLTSLEHLEIMISNNVKDLSSLKNLSNLRMLHIYTNIKLDIDILKNIKNLEKVYINGESINI